MSDGPGFDPYVILGVAVDADEIAIQLAYRARIRAVHPDVAGSDGLETTKRLNIARDWLLDPERRAQLARSGPSAARGGGNRPARPPTWRPRSRSASAGPTSAHARGTAAPRPHDQGLRTFLQKIRGLRPDERVRVNHSLGDTVPVFFGDYAEYLEPGLATRSFELGEIVAQTWFEGVDEEAPSNPALGRIVPNGFHVANAYAQWQLLGAYFRGELADVFFHGDDSIETLARRATEPWEAAIGQPRYGPFGGRVLDCFRIANSVPADAAERLARSWRLAFGAVGAIDARDEQGPGVWLPVPPRCPPALAVSGYVAAVDATRILPPGMLDPDLRPAFTFALRLTAHSLALGPNAEADRYLLPWSEAIGPQVSADAFAAGAPPAWGRATR